MFHINTPDVHLFFAPASQRGCVLECIVLYTLSFEDYGSAANFALKVTDKEVLSLKFTLSLSTFKLCSIGSSLHDRMELFEQIFRISVGNMSLTNDH